MRVDSYSLGLQSSYESAQLVASRVSQEGEMVHTVSLNQEHESLSLSATGVVLVQDEEINFELSAALIRNERYTTQSLVAQSAIDPLVIGLGGELASVDMNRTFEFDLNSDGNNDEIALLAHNSGFLVLDKNDNGVIDDGSELFGTQSGDGFADLAMYDEDQNGVIDENDAVFDQLQIWQKSALQDNLISLKQAKVGALLLENVASKFTYTQEGQKSASLENSGVVLFENGKAGWMSHVDFFITQKESESQNTQEGGGATTLQNLFNTPQSSSTSSNTHDALVEMLEKRLHALESKLSKTHDKDQKQALNLQIMAISQQIALLEFG